MLYATHYMDEAQHLWHPRRDGRRGKVLLKARRKNWCGRARVCENLRSSSSSNSPADGLRD